MGWPPVPRGARIAYDAARAGAGRAAAWLPSLPPGLPLPIAPDAGDAARIGMAFGAAAALVLLIVIALAVAARARLAAAWRRRGDRLRARGT